MPLLPLFVARNLSDNSIAEKHPSDFILTDADTALFESVPKKDRYSKILLNDKTNWFVYSTCAGMVPGAPISHANPVTRLRGVVADFDRRSSVEQAEAAVRQELEPMLWPNYFDVGWTGNIRLIWIFADDVVAVGDVANKIIERMLLKKLKADTLLVGYDKASAKPSQRWTRGRAIVPFNTSPIPTDWLTGVRMEILREEAHNSSDNLDLAVIEERVTELGWRDRWTGEFKYESVGVRFWDDRADNSNGAMLLQHGVHCVTGPRLGLVPWKDILGVTWWNERQTSQLGAFAKDIYADGEGYWYRSKQTGLWLRDKADRIAMMLRVHGLSGTKQKGETSSQIDDVMHFIHEQQRVVAAAPLLYRPDGVVVNDEGHLMLNISTVRALSPAAGPAGQEQFPWIWNYLSGFLNGGEEARDTMLAWIQRAYKGAYTLNPQKGQAVFICGPKDTGKTLFTDRILKPLLGNLVANPFEYFVGKNRFTDNLLTVGLLAINDEESPTGAEKDTFLTKVKSFVVNNFHKYEAKGKAETTIDWCGRLVVTLNETSKDLGILPEINPNTSDKIMLFSSRVFTGVWPEKAKLEATIRTELPHFARWLLDSFTASSDIMSGGRMGVKSYHDEEVLRRSHELQPEHHFYSLLRDWAEQTDSSDTWEGEPMKLYNMFDALKMTLAGIRFYNPEKIGRCLATLIRQGKKGIKELGPDKGYELDPVKLRPS